MEYQHSDSLMIKKIIGNVQVIAHYLYQIEQFLDFRQKRIFHVCLIKIDEINESPSFNTEVRVEMGENSENAGVMSQNYENQNTEQEYGLGKIPSPETSRGLETEIRIMSVIVKELPNEGRIGYILPLNCGHNGTLSLAELNLFQKHLINAQIVALAEGADITENEIKS